MAAAVRYRVVLEWDAEDKEWCVSVPAIPGCFTHGASMEEALRNAKEAIELNLEDMKARGETMPSPESVRVEEVAVRLPK